MPKLLTILAFAGLVMGLSSDVKAGPVCESALDSGWVGTDQNLMMALRSNARHFWAWAKVNDRKYLPENLLKQAGLVGGDLHHEQFFYAFFGDKKRYVLNDFDDVGWGPLFIDFLKFHGVTMSLGQKDLKFGPEEMLRSYLSGLSGEKWKEPLPGLLEADAYFSKADMSEKYFAKIKELTTDGLFLPLEGLTLWKDLSRDQQKEFQALESKYFADVLPKGYEIMDRAIFVKGSKSGRYWYYVKKSKTERHILEFKESQEPAVSLYGDQSRDVKARLDQAVQLFWNGELPTGFAVTGDASRVFMMRPKLPSLIDFNASLFRDSPEDYADLSLYQAFLIGQLHAQQAINQDYVNLLRDDFTGIVRAMHKMTHDYLKEARAKR